MNDVVVPSPLRGEGQGEGTASKLTRTYGWVMPSGWWTHRGHYFWYTVREFTALPLAVWLLWFLVEIKQAGGGAAGYSPHGSTAFVVFSVVCFLFALYHSVTFLSLAGVIIHLKVMDRPVPSRLIVASQFGLWLVASILIGAVLIGFAR
jgi:fumarate reductase subunit C